MIKYNKKLLLILGLGFLIFIFLFFYMIKVKPSDELIEVKKGDTFYSIAAVLLKNRIIRSRRLFILLVKITGQSKKLKIGFYRFNKIQNLFYIIKSLTKGDIANRIITIPEGYNVFQIAEILERKNITTKSSFLKLVHDKEILNKFNINQDTAEGFLYPDTYYIPYNISARKIIKMMIENFFIHIHSAYVQKLKEKYGSIEKAITLASLVEWEAKVDYERPIIAGVFLNRIKRNMNLQSCATVMYTLNNHKPRLLFKDLKIKSLYNTYLYKGLPPSPICNPSEKSILAVIYPAKVNYLYFVSMQHDSHYFSSSYQQHLKAYKYFILKDKNIDPFK